MFCCERLLYAFQAFLFLMLYDYGGGENVWKYSRFPGHVQHIKVKSTKTRDTAVVIVLFWVWSKLDMLFIAFDRSDVLHI